MPYLRSGLDFLFLFRRLDLLFLLLRRLALVEARDDLGQERFLLGTWGDGFSL